MSNHPGPVRNRLPASGAAKLAAALVLVGLALILLWLAISAARLASAGRSLREQQLQLEELLSAGILNADPAQIESMLVTVSDDINVIHDVAGPFAIAGRYLGWLPVVGPLAADAEALLAMADAGSEMAHHAQSALNPLLRLAQNADRPSGDDSPAIETLPKAIQALTAAEPALIRADQAATILFDSRSRLEHSDAYPDQLADLLAQLDDNATLIQDGLKLALIAPELLGVDRPKTYLILAQNEDELRPTGGYVSGAGVLTIYQGQITSLEFQDAHLVDDWQNKPYDLPPAPFTEFMGMDIFLFRDANFWPDFPTSAAKAMELYSYGQDVPLDGVLAFDQQFMQQLLAATGPLPVPELERVVDAQSVVAQLREEWGPAGDDANWISQRKAFMGPLANAFRSQVDSGLLSARSYELLQALQKAAMERHLQLFVADPAMAEILNQTSWSGRLAPVTEQDFLHIANTNMGFNKVNAAVNQTIVYQVALNEENGSTANLQIGYKNPPAPEPVDCQHGTLYAPDTQYVSLTSDCYWNYIRVYVPAGSELLAASELPLLAGDLMSGVAWPGQSRRAGAEDAKLTAFDQFLMLAPGQDATVEFIYSLPNSVLQEQDGRYRYQLQIRKQAGTDTTPSRVHITLPAGAEPVQVTPQPKAINRDTLVFESPLVNDLTISIEYRR